MTVAACAEIVQRGDPDRFRATMAAPVSARAVLFPIYAFNLEVARAPWMTSEPMIAEMRLQWWRDALDEIAQGGPVRRHEVATPLSDVMDAEGAAVLDRLIEARRFDVAAEPFPDEAALAEYLDATAGGLMWVAGRALGAPTGEEARLRTIGWAMGLANFLCALPELERRGRRPLPHAQFQPLSALARRGLDRLGHAGRPQDRAARTAALAAWQSRTILRRAAADPSRVAAGQLAPGPIRSRLGLILRSVRP